MAFLKQCGKVPSSNAKLMILVMGKTKESRQDLRRKVGMMSREQVALEEDRIAARTSAVFVGEKELKDGGARGRWNIWGGEWNGGKRRV